MSWTNRVSGSVVVLLGWMPTAMAAEVATRPFGEIRQYAQHSVVADVIALEHVKLSAEIAGRVDALHAETGDEIRKGQLLVQLGCRDYEAQLALQKAQEQRLAKELKWQYREVRRLRSLMDSEHVSQSSLDSQERRSDNLEAQRRVQDVRIRSAMLQVERCAIRSPVDGTVTARYVNVAEWVSVGAPLLSVINPRKVVIEAQVPHDQSAAFLQARRYWVGGSVTHDLDVVSALPMIDSRNNTRAIRLRGDVPLPAGSRVTLHWQSNQPQLPPNFLYGHEEHLGIWVGENGTFTFIPLPDAQEGRFFAVPPLADETLVVSGNDHLIGAGATHSQSGVAAKTSP